MKDGGERSEIMRDKGHGTKENKEREKGERKEGGARK